MKIGLGFPQYNRKGGIERIFAELGAQFQARGHAVHFYAHSWIDVNGDRASFHRVPILPWPSYTRPVTYALATRQLQARGAVDILQLASGCGARQDIVCAQSCHRAWVVQSRAALRPGSKRWWLKTLNPRHYLVCALERMQYTCGHYTQVIAVSEQVKQDIMRFYHVPESDIVVVPNGVNLDEFQPGLMVQQRLPVRTRLGLVPDDKMLLFVANEFPRKGLDTLLEALALLRDPQIKLVIVGRGDARPYQPVLARLGLAAQIVFHPGTAAIAPYYAASDLFVFPTLYEPFGLVIIEALACGLPVITSACAGAAPAVNNANGRLLAEPQDAQALAQHIQTLLARPVTEYHAAARQAAARYGWEQIAGEYLAVYERVLAQRVGQARVKERV
jgi:UDP-glucose:(heptosyl)LPS alpha-1,3-glucosyltransferase